MTLLEVMLASTAIAELTAVSLRPSFAEEAVLHDIAVLDVMVASASEAAPAEPYARYTAPKAAYKRSLINRKKN